MDREPEPAMIIDGVKWWNWLYAYEHEGKQYSFSVCATSRDDADSRLRKIALARCEGQSCGAPLQVMPDRAGAWLLTAAAKLRRLFNRS